MRIVYTGPLSPGETCEMRRHALERLGHTTVPVDSVPFVRAVRRLPRAVQWRLRWGPMVARYNAALRARLDGTIDALWVDKGMFVHPGVLRSARARGARWLVHYSPDNYLLRQNASRHLWRGLPLYDLVVTTKRSLVDALAACGARQVALSGNAYDPAVHRPVALAAAERAEYDCDVSFVGRWEPLREAWLARLLRLGVRVVVRGEHWQRASDPVVRAAWRGGPALGDAYAKAVCGARVNLTLLSRTAGDEITQRSVEIPACGGFMLAERTAEHLATFADGREAVYFSGPDELCRQVRYYLVRDAARRCIAEAGRARCLASGYAYDDRLRAVLGRLETTP